MIGYVQGYTHLRMDGASSEVYDHVLLARLVPLYIAQRPIYLVYIADEETPSDSFYLLVMGLK